MRWVRAVKLCLIRKYPYPIDDTNILSSLYLLEYVWATKLDSKTPELTVDIPKINVQHIFNLKFCMCTYSYHALLLGYVIEVILDSSNVATSVWIKAIVVIICNSLLTYPELVSLKLSKHNMLSRWHLDYHLKFLVIVTNLIIHLFSNNRNKHFM